MIRHGTTIKRFKHSCGTCHQVLDVPSFIHHSKKAMHARRKPEHKTSEEIRGRETDVEIPDFPYES